MSLVRPLDETLPVERQPGIDTADGLGFCGLWAISQ